MATRQPRARKEKSKTASALLEALKFISVAQHSEGQPYQTHCRLANGTLMAFDGGLTVGMYVDETLTCAPHTNTLIAALNKCSESIAITMLDSGKLSIKSGKFRGMVPCAPLETIMAGQPDPPCAVVTDAIKPALAACLSIARDGEPAPTCGVLLQAGSACATDRHLFIEAWHGEDLPRIFLPRVSAKAIAESTKVLKEFGFSPTSATFYFEDQSFIKTQLFEDTFPKYEHILNAPSNPWPIPGGFYEGLQNIEPFSDKYVYFFEGKMSSSRELNDGSTYDVEGLPIGMMFNIEQLKTLRPYLQNIDFRKTQRNALFFSQDGLVRGAIAHIVSHDQT